ncbi:Zn-dependent oxidoreductase, partial [bacterium]
DQLGLQHPALDAKPTGQTLLVWGGSTSVGSNAIQLAVAAGYEVITTASPKNFEYVKQLGASQVFDYNSPTVVKDIIKAFQGNTSAGAIAIGSTSVEACLDIMNACEGNKFVSIATFPVSFDTLAPSSNVRLQMLKQAPRLLSFGLSMVFKSRLRRIRTSFIIGTTLMNNEVSKVIYEDFLPQALAIGSYVAAPEPHVVGKGLDCVQVGLDLQVKGVSAKKIVVSL